MSGGVAENRTAVSTGMAADDGKHVVDGCVQIRCGHDPGQGFVDDLFRFDGGIQLPDRLFLLLFQLMQFGCVDADSEQQPGAVGKRETVFHGPNDIFLPVFVDQCFLKFMKFA